MGVLTNIYCIPRAPGSVAWSTLLAGLAGDALVRAPYRAGTPFLDDADRSGIVRPENWIAPETLQPSVSRLPRKDFGNIEDALAYLALAGDATITMDAPQPAFHVFPDARPWSAAVALYRFGAATPFRVGVPQDFSDLVDEFPELANQPTEPRWQGTLSELLWIHGKCVPTEDEFLGSPIQRLLQSLWPDHLLLAEEFL